MEFRSAKYTPDGRIDCEINHPKFGWLPFTADPNDTEKFGAQIFDAAKDIADPYVPEPEPEPEPVAITSNQVDAERDRRLAAGTVVTVTGYGDIAVQGRMQDAVNYLALQSKAARLDDQGVTDPVISFRDRDNTMHDLTPAQLVELIDASVEHAQAVYASAWALKDGSNGTPQDYTDDEYWP